MAHHGEWHSSPPFILQRFPSDLYRFWSQFPNCADFWCLAGNQSCSIRDTSELKRNNRTDNLTSIRSSEERVLSARDTSNRSECAVIVDASQVKGWGGTDASDSSEKRYRNRNSRDLELPDSDVNGERSDETFWIAHGKRPNRPSMNKCLWLQAKQNLWKN